MKIIHNCLSNKEFKTLQTTLTSNDFPWFYREAEVKKETDSEYFTHSFFHAPNTLRSKWYGLIVPILEKIKCTSLVWVRANLLINKSTPIRSALHRDMGSSKGTTAIFYVNSNNGFTLLKTDKGDVKSSSEENKLIIFDSQTLHQSVRQTNTNQRITINFNFKCK
jgi:hypothetical protein|tara:strand:+ start:1224 stop:1718 length:495 start_codon:yes stop_codon:yes gene_type:complete